MQNRTILLHQPEGGPEFSMKVTDADKIRNYCSILSDVH